MKDPAGESDAALIALLGRFGQERGHTVSELLASWRALEPPISLEQFLVGERIMTRFALAKVRAVRSGLLELDDLSPAILAEGPGTRPPTGEEPAQAASAPAGLAGDEFDAADLDAVAAAERALEAVDAPADLEGDQGDEDVQRAPGHPSSPLESTIADAASVLQEELDKGQSDQRADLPSIQDLDPQPVALSVEDSGESRAVQGWEYEPPEGDPPSQGEATPPRARPRPRKRKRRSERPRPRRETVRPPEPSPEARISSNADLPTRKWKANEREREVRKVPDTRKTSRDKLRAAQARRGDDHVLGSETEGLLRMVQPGDVLGSVTVGEPFATGGTSVVYRGLHQTLGVPVVVKVLKPAYSLRDGPELKRFLQEAQIGARLNHPSFVRVFDAGSHHGLAFIVMEHVEGDDLKSYMANHRLGPKQARNLLVGLARILRLAHQRGVIHRDVKPHNFFVSHKGTIKLGDFGLARLIDADSDPVAPSGGQSLGTPSYVAPEQVLDMETVDHRGDIYSLGIILFEILTGRVPFSGADGMEIALKQVRDPLPWHLLPKHTPHGLRVVLERMLSKEPDGRYPTYDHLLLALKKADVAKRSSTGLVAGLKRLFGGSEGADA